MILASAQTYPKRGDIEANLSDHYNLIGLASRNGADLIVFPEMSITGYERERARDLAFTVNDPRLEELKRLSVDKQIIVAAGAPIAIDGRLFIGAFILKPDFSASIYAKQFLHAGEEAFFSSTFDYNPRITINDRQSSIAICADIDHPQHAANAGKSGTDIYIASLFFSPGGIPGAYHMLAGYARQYEMNVLMSNYCGQVWGIDSGGQSAFWDKKGRLIAKLNADDPGLLLVENTGDEWAGTSVKYE